MEKPIIRTWLQKGIGLIILHPSGVLYTNQVGGYACLHPEIEGVFVPLFDELKGEEQESKLKNYFTNSKWNGSCCNGIDNETADLVDKVLADSFYTSRLKVNREKLSESCESWIHVKILSQEEKQDELQEFYGFESNLGVITWENSD